jgi:hypothetical protein
MRVHSVEGLSGSRMVVLRGLLGYEDVVWGRNSLLYEVSTPVALEATLHSII